MKNALLIAAAVLGMSATVAEANIDCRIDLRPVERRICADSTLLDRDATMSAYYFRLRNDLSRRGARDLLENQREWLSLRNQCTSNKCLLEMYDMRIRALREVLD